MIKIVTTSSALGVLNIKFIKLIDFVSLIDLNSCCI